MRRSGKAKKQKTWFVDMYVESVRSCILSHNEQKLILDKILSYYFKNHYQILFYLVEFSFQIMRKITIITENTKKNENVQRAAKKIPRLGQLLLLLFIAQPTTMGHLRAN